MTQHSHTHMNTHMHTRLRTLTPSRAHIHTQRYPSRVTHDTHSGRACMHIYHSLSSLSSLPPLATQGFSHAPCRSHSPPPSHPSISLMVPSTSPLCCAVSLFSTLA